MQSPCFDVGPRYGNDDARDVTEDFIVSRRSEVCRVPDIDIRKCHVPRIDDGRGIAAQDAAAATDPSVPLTQLQLQNIFIPESFDSTGYSNQFIVQPVLPFTIKEDGYFPYHTHQLS